MKLPVRDLLNERTAPLRGRARLLTVVASIAVHVFLVVAFVFAPMLSADDDEMPEYVAVQIVPAQMLGTSTPVDPSPRPVREEPPAETTLPEPEPEPEQQEEAPPPKPTVPDPESRRPPQQQAPAPRRVQARETGALQQREGSPTGNPLGTSNFGAAVGFDNPDFTYDYYVDSMLAAIRPHWARPSIGGTVEAMVQLPHPQRRARRSTSRSPSPPATTHSISQRCGPCRPPRRCPSFHRASVTTRSA